jgi:hypothetical protein
MIYAYYADILDIVVICSVFCFIYNIVVFLPIDSGPRPTAKHASGPYPVLWV